MPLVLRIFVFSLMISLISPQFSEAQISNHLFQALPDTLKPKDPQHLTIAETQKILSHTYEIEEWTIKEYEQTDSLCLLFAPRYKDITTLKEQRTFLFDICQYLFRATNYHKNKKSLRGRGNDYNYPYQEIGMQYCNLYLKLFPKSQNPNLGQFSRVLAIQAVFQIEEDNFENAYFTLKKAIAVAKQSRDSNVVLPKYTTIAQLFERLELPLQTLIYADSAGTLIARLAQTPKNLALAAYIIRLKQVANFTLYQSTKEAKYSQRIFSLHEEAKLTPKKKWYKRLLAYSYVLTAGIAFEEGKYPEVLARIDSAYHTFPNLEIIDGWESAMVYKGLSLRRMGLASQSEKVFTKLNLTDYRKPVIYKVLQELYQEQRVKGNTTKALAYHEQMMQFQERKHLLELQGKALEMKQVFDLGQRDQHILYLTERQKYGKIIFLFILTISILIILGLIWRYQITLKRTEELVHQIEDSTKLQVYEIEAAREEERKILGQDLHDNLTSSIAAVSHQIELLILDHPTNPVGDKLKLLQNQINEIYQISRDKSHKWFKDSASNLTDTVFASRMESLVNGAFPAPHYKKNLDIDTAALSYLDFNAKIHLLRIIQEALTNILKHGKANSITLLIYEELNTVHLNLSDNGRGFDIQEVAKKGSVGILSIQDRAAKLCGQLTINSSFNGTEIRLSIPKPRYKLYTEEANNITLQK
ncbi:sensor histidine kinase [Dyadobacter tibetensis]|uniref:sensor histidine kinase n=1 Tax=Dyadobacter tibetensis TaxID=1211851 RepID=UPI0004B8F8C2|nr:ATP-binding protein [Dyadobacter tibetensis]